MTFPDLNSLEDMISQDEALERYPWLSAHILGRWRRNRKIRAFTGREGGLVYALSDLVQATNEELQLWDGEENPENADCSNTKNNGSTGSQAGKDSTDTGTISEVAALKEKRSLAILFPPQKNTS